MNVHRLIVSQGSTYVDSDIELVIETIIKQRGNERNVAIDALYELLKKERIPSIVLHEICDLFEACPQNGGAAWLIASTLKNEFEKALGTLDFCPLLREVSAVCDRGNS